MSDIEEIRVPEQDLQLSEAQLRRSASYQKHRIVVVGIFVVAIVACGFGFTPLGQALGRLVAGMFDSSVAGGAEAKAAGLRLLIGANIIGVVLTFALSLFVGPRVPAGFAHVVLGITVPLSLATMQATLFKLTDGAGGVVDTQFARWSFVVMFILTLAVVEVGVALGRRMLEKRAG